MSVFLNRARPRLRRGFGCSEARTSKHQGRCLPAHAAAAPALDATSAEKEEPEAVSFSEAQVAGGTGSVDLAEPAALDGSQTVRALLAPHIRWRQVVLVFPCCLGKSAGAGSACVVALPLLAGAVACSASPLQRRKSIHAADAPRAASPQADHPRVPPGRGRPAPFCKAGLEGAELHSTARRRHPCHAR